jgi:hypothetical protein
MGERCLGVTVVCEAELDFEPFVRDHFASGTYMGLTLVKAFQRDSTLSVIFDGHPGVRAGRFGVRIATPKRIGDERWRALCDSDDPEEWASMAVPLGILEPYETTAPSYAGDPDAAGVLWLT